MVCTIKPLLDLVPSIITTICDFRLSYTLHSGPDSIDMHLPCAGYIISCHGIDFQSITISMHACAQS